MKNRFDAVVVGAGIAGLSVARELAKRGQRVLLLEREKQGGKTSRAAAGILDPYTEAGEETPLLKLGMKALEIYPGFLEEIGPETRNQVEYEKLGVLYLAMNSQDETFLQDRFGWQKKRKIPVQWVSANEIQRLEPHVSKRAQSGVFYPEVPKLNAAKLLEALTASVRKAGIEIRNSDSMGSVWIEEKKVCGVETSQGRIESQAVVLASGCWAAADPKLGLSASVSPVRGQILLLHLNGSFQPKHILHTTRYAYMVPWPGNRLLVGSTLESVGFDDRVTPEGAEEILKRISEIFEEIRKFPIELSWSGLRPFSQKGFPLIGPTAVRGLFVAEGYYRSGILIGPLVGKLLAEGILSGKFSPLLEPFYPK